MGGSFGDPAADGGRFQRLLNAICDAAPHARTVRSGTPGFATAAAIGQRLALDARDDDAPVLAIESARSFLVGGHEMLTASQYGVAAKAIVLESPDRHPRSPDLPAMVQAMHGQARRCDACDLAAGIQWLLRQTAPAALFAGPAHD